MKIQWFNLKQGGAIPPPPPANTGLKTKGLDTIEDIMTQSYPISILFMITDHSKKQQLLLLTFPAKRNNRDK